MALPKHLLHKWLSSSFPSNHIGFRSLNSKPLHFTVTLPHFDDLKQSETISRIFHYIFRTTKGKKWKMSTSFHWNKELFRDTFSLLLLLIFRHPSSLQLIHFSPAETMKVHCILAKVHCLKWGHATSLHTQTRQRMTSTVPTRCNAVVLVPMISNAGCQMTMTMKTMTTACIGCLHHWKWNHIV